MPGTLPVQGRRVAPIFAAMHDRIDPATAIGASRPLIGMIHLEPLPGAPRWAGSMNDVLDAALRDAAALAAAGADGIMVENFGDAPFFATRVPPETVAAMSVCAIAVAREAGLPIGINVLRNDAAAALAVAVAVGAVMIRVNVHTGAMLTDQGWIEGRAARTLRRRAALGSRIAILADVLVKHAAAPVGVDVITAARDSWQRGHADALIVSGSATGEPASVERVEIVRAAAPAAPVWIGSGITERNAAALLKYADGAIIGSSLQDGGVAGRRIDVERARRIFDACRAN